MALSIQRATDISDATDYDRSKSAFEVNVKAEKEIETILLHLEHQNDLMLKILDKLENERRADRK
jgi:uncharacterized membrane protein